MLSSGRKSAKAKGIQGINKSSLHGELYDLIICYVDWIFAYIASFDKHRKISKKFLKIF